MVITGAIIRAKLSQIITTNKPSTNFLQAGCPSYRPTNSIKALKGRLRLFQLLLGNSFNNFHVVNPLIQIFNENMVFFIEWHIYKHSGDM